MFANVIIGVDGRPGGRDAIALGKLLADPDAAVALAHVHGDGGTAGYLYAFGEAFRMLEGERDATGIGARLMSVMSFSAGRSRTRWSWSGRGWGKRLPAVPPRPDS